MALKGTGQATTICRGDTQEGQGGAAWPWLGAALALTNRIAIGPGATAPIFRCQPAIVAQVFATLGYIFPGRVFLGLGTGESLNEVPSGND